ncbi:sensor domain-containing diguanylate cyclase [Anaerosinus massiliensis]|uniref:sensor domain-containing diguanylate cyclase n=1 Tax=Massilibacillus massiliensis TaxID=1806837 RepID=UPI000DA60A82|nr:diguanylate cyclase [Massilibacillus massiliensis]
MIRNQADTMGKSTTKLFDLETYRTLLEYNGDILFEWDLETDRFFVTANWFDIFGYMPSSYNFSREIENSTNIHPDDLHKFKDYIKTIYYNQHDLANKKFFSKLELRFRNSYDAYVWCKVSLATDFSSRNLPYKISGIITDIDFDKKQCETLLNQAQKDLLTGLYNKVTTQQFIEECLQQHTSSKHALLIIDIDGFKAINDTFGHLFGDAVISDLATTIKSNFLDSDIVGRIGGDEFMVLMKNFDQAKSLQQKSQNLIDALRRSYITDRKEYRLSGSIGIAIYPIHSKTFSELFSAADQALYYAKGNGKNRYIIYAKQLPKVDYQNPRINHDANLSQGKKSFHDNLPEYIFKLLYSSVDSTATAKMLLELLGKHFNVSRTFIYERSKNGNHYTITFQWCNQNITPIKQALKILPADKVETFYTEQQQQNLLNCSDITLLPEKQRKHFAKENIKACLHSRIIENGIPKGCIGFDECTLARKWTTEEIDILTITAEMLATFLLKKNSLKGLKKTKSYLLDILHHVNAWLCVVDRYTHDILFINRKLNADLCQHKHGNTCHQIFHNRETPCIDCPMKRLSLTDRHTTKEVYNQTTRTWQKVTISKINWDDYPDACLIQIDDISAQKELEFLPMN